MPARSALTRVALRVFGPEASVRITAHGGVVVTDSWHTDRLTVVEGTPEEAVAEAMRILGGRDDHVGGR